MTVTRIDPGKRLSGAVVHNETVYIAGQVAEKTKADIKGQTQEVLLKIEKLLQKAGSNKANLLSVQIFLPDMRNFAAMNEVWDKWVDPANTPARATIQAALATPELLVEIMVTAAKISK
jgi:enamine deaminase RidA (YjgF/YER057c/UK114 family)